MSDRMPAPETSTAAPLHVLLVAAATSTTGGGERHVADLLRLLPERGLRVSLACPPGGALPALARSLGVDVREVAIERGLRPSALLALRRAIAELAPDVVHAHGSRAAAFVRVADPKARSRVVYTLHGIHVDKAGSRARRTAFLALERLLRPRTARFVTVCASDLHKGERLGLLDPTRASVVYNGVAVPGRPEAPGRFRGELGLDPDVPLALSVGRFHEQKDQLTLLAAWARVLDRCPAAVLALVGSGELESALRGQAAALRLGDSLRFVAPRGDLAPAYVDADVFVLTSLWEGLPYVVLEAMSHALPVAATAVDGVPEAVTDGECGILFAPQDPGLAAATVVTLLSDPDGAASMGEAGRARVAALFGLDAMADATAAVYRRVSPR
jgi:glycosyltransferase involved in cell wall biosynthesis